MTRPEPYAQRIRARPYGPRELVAGGVTAWFHGPFAVLTLSGGERTLTFRADLADPYLGTDLHQLFVAAENQEDACLPQADRLVAGQPIGDDVPVVVRRLTARPVAEGASLTLSTSELTVDVTLSLPDTGRIAAEIRRWVDAR